VGSLNFMRLSLMKGAHAVLSAFARKLDVPANRITQILKGERYITADTAIRLGHFFGTSAEFWMNLQSIYDLRLAQDRNGLAIKALPTLRQACRGPHSSLRVPHVRTSVRGPKKMGEAPQSSVFSSLIHKLTNPKRAPSTLGHLG
jgi:addiction module HigA family antidote